MLVAQAILLSASLMSMELGKLHLKNQKGRAAESAPVDFLGFLGPDIYPIISGAVAGLEVMLHYTAILGISGHGHNRTPPPVQKSLKVRFIKQSLILS